DLDGTAERAVERDGLVGPLRLHPAPPHGEQALVQRAGGVLDGLGRGGRGARLLEAQHELHPLLEILRRIAEAALRAEPLGTELAQEDEQRRASCGAELLDAVGALVR